MNALSCSCIIYKSSGSSYIEVFAAPATCSLLFPLHFGLAVNATFALNPVRCVARGARDKVMEFPLIFLHVPCRGIACGGRMGSLSPCSICSSPFQVDLFTCHHVIYWVFLEGTIWKFSLGRCFRVCFFTAVSGGEKKNLCVRIAWRWRCIQIPPPKVGKYLSARSSTSSSDFSSQSFVAVSGSSVGFSLGCEYQHKNEFQLCPRSPAEHLGHTPNA